MSLDSVVSISITRATKVPTRAGFGKLAFMCFHTLTPDLYNEVSSADEVLDLGATVVHPAYKAALRYFSQDPSPETMFIVKRQTFTQLTHLTPLDTTEGYVYEFTVVDPAGVATDISYTVLAAATTTTVGTALAALIDPLTYMTAAQVGATHVLVTSAAGKIAQFKSLPNPNKLKVYCATAAGTDAADIATWLAAERDFYAIAWDHQGELGAVAAAAPVEAVRKMMFVDTSDYECIDPADTDDVGSQLEALSYARTTCFYLANETNGDQSVGFCGRNLPYDPGSETWNMKTITGIAADDLLTGQETALEDKYINYYVEQGGLSVTHWGTVPDHDYIDIIRGADWLHARMGERIFAGLYNQPKVPFTDIGIAAVESMVRAQLEEAVTVGLINPGYTVSVPLAADVDAADKAARTLPGITFIATFQGAIHKVIPLRGTIGL